MYEIIIRVGFIIGQYGNDWEAVVRDSTYPEYVNILKGNDLHNINEDTYNFTIATEFFNKLKIGEFVCAKDTKILIFLRKQTGVYGSQYIEDRFRSKWGTIDFFEVSKEKFPHGKRLIGELVSKIKDCRPMIEGELTQRDYKQLEHIEHIEKYGFDD